MTDTELTKMLRSSANRVVTYAADRIEALTAERDGLLRCVTDNHVALCRAESAEAERDRLREAIDYVLDGMGIADPDYDIDPDDDFLDAANSEWVRDTLTHLAAALKGATP